MNNLVAADIMVARIKTLETELAELKAAIPQIKHDAIFDMQQSSSDVVTTNCRCGSLGAHDEFAYNYAEKILAQAKELKK